MSDRTTIVSGPGEHRTAGKMDKRALLIRQSFPRAIGNAGVETQIEVRRVRPIDRTQDELQIDIEIVKTAKNGARTSHLGSIVVGEYEIAALIQALSTTIHSETKESV